MRGFSRSFAQTTWNSSKSCAPRPAFCFPYQSYASAISRRASVEISTWYTLRPNQLERFIDARTLQTTRAQSTGSRLEFSSLCWSDVDTAILEAVPKSLDQFESLVSGHRLDVDCCGPAHPDRLPRDRVERRRGRRRCGRARRWRPPDR